MVEGQGTGYTAPTRQIPLPSWSQLFLVSLLLLGLVWLPLAVIQQIDALIMYTGWLEAGANILLAYAVVAFGCALLATAACVLRRGRWLAVLIPTILICVFQFVYYGLLRYAYFVRLWLGIQGDEHLQFGSQLRLAVAVILVTGLAFVIWRFQHAIAAGVLRLARELRAVILGLLAASIPIAVIYAIPPAQRQFPARGADSPDVILITFDALAEADANVCGPGPTLMPNLRRFAANGSCFSRFYASSNYTVPTTSTLETGLLPWSHWAVSLGSKIAEPYRTNVFSQRMREAGYRTYSISANDLASPVERGTQANYDRAILETSYSLRAPTKQAQFLFRDSYLHVLTDPMTRMLDSVDRYVSGTRFPFPPEHVFEHALPILAERTQSKFIWLHVLPPHWPYLPPPSAKYKLLPPGKLDRWAGMMAADTSFSQAEDGVIADYRKRYDECIMGADEALGKFLEKLEADGVMDRSIVIVSADHGELFEKGYMGHGGPLLFEPVIHVPLVVKLPGQTEGRTITQPVSQADIGPTILELVGAPALEHSDGRSLAPLLRGDTLPDAPVFSMSLERSTRYATPNAGQIAIINGNHKLTYDIQSSAVTLYDVAADPHEERDLAAAESGLASELKAMLDQHMNAAENGRRFLYPAAQ